MPFKILARTRAHIDRIVQLSGVHVPCNAIHIISVPSEGPSPDDFFAFMHGVGGAGNTRTAARMAEPDVTLRIKRVFGYRSRTIKKTWVATE